MPRTCNIRGHDKRRAIEKAFLAGDALRSVDQTRAILEQPDAPEPLFEEASSEVAR